MENIYGIDLGTTNSLIGLHKTGYLSDLIPSCVDLETGKAGKDYFDNMSAKRSFKVDMSMGIEGISPRYASTCVLRELCNQVKDDKVHSVVISVPAYFTDSQRTATITAACDLGLDVKGLVNEPTAAAMYIAQQNKGLYVVFDLGGGTFDISVIDSRFSFFDVQATTGRIVGGDNFDKNITRHFIKEGGIPFHKISEKSRMALQHFASKMKIKMQKEQHDFEVDLSMFGGHTMLFTEDNYVQLMKMTFGDCVSDMQTLINTCIPEGDPYEILMVGGSTHCPYLRQYITETVGQAPAPITYDPDRVVAQGAALYADLIEQGVVDQKVSDVTRALSIGLDDGTVQVVVPANSKIPLSTENMFTNPVDAKTLELNLYQGENMLAKDNEMIGRRVYDYDVPKAAGTGQVVVTVSIDNMGVINLEARELLGEPKTIVIKRNAKD